MTRSELLDEVERNIETPVSAITFTCGLEDVYRSTVSERHRPALLVAGAIGMAVLWLFVLESAFFSERPSHVESFEMWLAVMGGINLLVTAFLAIQLFTVSHRVRDNATIAILVTISALICYSYYCDDSDLRNISLFCYVLMPLACNSLLSQYFWQALLTTAAACLFYVILLFIVHDIDVQVKFLSTVTLVSASAMTLWGNYRSDRGERAAFLYLTRERLISEASARQNAELREMSAVDPLTGIPNRRAYEETFRRLEALCEAEAQPIAVMMIDIDHFKLFNDHYGHLEGDRCLQSVAMTLAEQLRGADDLVARLGGEEFVMVMPRLGAGEIATVLERIRLAIERIAIRHEGVRGQATDVVTISIGGAVAEAGDAERRHSLLTYADRALYHAKREGRNRWCLS